jgi:parvulin-like peptidyl-prolyl isomerase
VLSGYGVHLVYIYEFRQAPPPLFEDVQQAVVQDWQTEQQEEFNEEFFKSLKSRYDVVIAEVPAGLILETGAENSTETKSDDQTGAKADPEP